MLRCIIVEDEPLALERLRDYAARHPLLEVVGTFETAAAALVFLAGHAVDLVFLDVRLGGWSGLELLETRTIAARVILTTAHQEYAVKAYDLDVADYLLKPFTFERFVQAVDRAQRAVPPAPASRDFLFVKNELRLERVPLHDVIVIEGQRDYRRIHLPSRRLMTLETFGELERRIPPDIVCRVHKSFMVALARIDAIAGGRITIHGMTIPISETYRERFYALIGHRG